jgi:hypothetical protein
MFEFELQQATKLVTAKRPPSWEATTIRLVAIATMPGRFVQHIHRWDIAVGQLLASPVPGIA